MNSKKRKELIDKAHAGMQYVQISEMERQNITLQLLNDDLTEEDRERLQEHLKLFKKEKEKLVDI